MSDKTKDARRRAYYAKLKDPRWQQMRLRVFERDKWKCVVCHGISAMDEDGNDGPPLPLHAHHLYYLPNCDPWDYPLDAIVTLCESCHEAEYERRRDYENKILHVLKKRGYFIAELHRLIECLDEPYMKEFLSETQKNVQAFQAWYANRCPQTKEEMDAWKLLNCRFKAEWPEHAIPEHERNIKD